jgi:hypothetical protein
MAYLTRPEEVLVALRSMPLGQATPVQAVKMLFLMEKKVPQQLGGAKFNFVPYDYGPFDQAVYSELDGLQRRGLVEIIEGQPRVYRLTHAGQFEAADLTRRLDNNVSDFLTRMGSWIASLNFAQLVSAIYREYPEMRANSIFRS